MLRPIFPADASDWPAARSWRVSFWSAHCIAEVVLKREVYARATFPIRHYGLACGWITSDEGRWYQSDREDRRNQTDLHSMDTYANLRS